MSFCCPPGRGCNDHRGDGRNGYLSARPECYRGAAARCVDPDLATLAWWWAERRDDAPWWRAFRRRHMTRRYRAAVALAFEAGITQRMIRLPLMGGLDPPPALADEAPSYPLPNPPAPPWSAR